MNGRNDTEVEDDGYTSDYWTGMDGPKDKTCPICRGQEFTGSRACGTMASDVDECPFCRGMGVVP